MHLNRYSLSGYTFYGFERTVPEQLTILFYPQVRVLLVAGLIPETTKAPIRGARAVPTTLI